MKKAIRIAALVAVAIVFLGTFVFLWKKSQPKEIVYETLTATETNLERTTVVTGNVEPRDEILIKPQISGIIAELFKEAGEPVKKGEVIARLKVIPEMTSINSAENRVRLAKLNARQAEVDFQRIETLYKKELIAATEYDQSRLALNKAKEEVKTAEDALQIVKEGFSASSAEYATTLVRSTIDGLVLDVPVKVGNSVIMSNSFNDGTTIATVADMNNLIFKGSIDETEVARLVKGMPMNVRIGALPDETFHATLEFIAPKVSSGTTANQFTIKGAMDKISGVTIRSGYSANATIVLESLKNVLSVPESAIEFAGDSSFVYRLTSKPDARPQTFERQAVTTGLSDGVNIQIKSGLKKGDLVRGLAKD